jgi:hypothetical protein
MKIVTIDFETYYDKDFSLSKLTTEEYIRSPQFEAICVGVKVGNQPTDVFAGNELGTLLKSMDYSDKAILCHNTAFDGAILSWKYGIKPAMWLDTLSMARALHNVTVGGSLAKLVKHYGLGEKGTEVVNALGKRAADFSPEELSKYADYCANDVDLTYKLFKVMSKGFPLSELRLIDVMIRCYTEPMIELNGGALADNLIRIAAQKQALIEKIAGGDEERFRKVLSSNPMFARLLELLGVDPPMKTSKTTGEITYAFAKNDEEFMALQDHPDPKVQAVMAARLGVKSTIQETRTKSFIAVSERGRLPIMLNYYGARTGRFCLTGGTQITVLRGGVVLDILIPELLPDDLVWDGEEFVTHGGLLDQGEREVMTYDGITGTPDHRVFCEEVAGTVELRMASERGYKIKTAAVAPRNWVSAGDANRRGQGGEA